MNEQLRQTEVVLDELLRAEDRRRVDLGAVWAECEVKHDGVAGAESIGFNNWRAITYARTYCGQNSNACGVFLNQPGKTDCAHFIAHCLAAGGIAIKTSDSTANFCPQGLAVRNTDLLAKLNEFAGSYSNVASIGLTDAIIGDIGFLRNLTRPSHAFMISEGVAWGDLLTPAKVYAHTANKCSEDMKAEIRQWFAAMFRITDA